MKGYEQYSDADLLEMAGVIPSKVNPIDRTVKQEDDYSNYSDADLMKIAGVNPAKVKNFPTSAKEILTNMRPEAINRVEAAARGAGQTATMGYGDEAYGKLRSLTRDASRGIEKTIYGDNMLSPISSTDAAVASREANKKAEEANPISYGSGGLAGIGLTGAAGAETAIGKQIASRVGSGNFAARTAKGMLSGATSGALYGSGAAEEGRRLEGAGQGAITGGAVGAALPIASAGINSLKKGTQNALTGYSARNTEQLEKTANELKGVSSAAYKEMRDAGVVLNKQANKQLASGIDDELSNIKLNSELHRQTLSILYDLKKSTKKGKLDLEELDQFRRLFTRVSASGEDMHVAGRVVDAIDDAVDNLTKKDLVSGDIKAVEALNKGRSEYKKYLKFDTLSNIIQKADGDPNKIKSSINSLLNNERKIRRFNDDEITALRSAAKATSPEKILKGFGRFGIDPNNMLLPFIGGGIAGVGLGTPVGAALVGGGTIARQLNKYLSRGKAENALRIIEAGGIPKELGQLPPKEAMAIIRSLKKGTDKAMTQQIVNSEVGVKQ